MVCTGEKVKGKRRKLPNRLRIVCHRSSGLLDYLAKTRGGWVVSINFGGYRKTTAVTGACFAPFGVAGGRSSPRMLPRARSPGALSSAPVAPLEQPPRVNPWRPRWAPGLFGASPAVPAAAALEVALAPGRSLHCCSLQRSQTPGYEFALIQCSATFLCLDTQPTSNLDSSDTPRARLPRRRLPPGRVLTQQESKARISRTITQTSLGTRSSICRQESRTCPPPRSLLAEPMPLR